MEVFMNNLIKVLITDINSEKELEENLNKLNNIIQALDVLNIIDYNLDKLKNLIDILDSVKIIDRNNCIYYHNSNGYGGGMLNRSDINTLIEKIESKLYRINKEKILVENKLENDSNDTSSIVE